MSRGQSSEQLSRPNLKVTVADEVRRWILQGRYVAGQKIDQEEIAHYFGISRVPIREALIALEAEGLVENIDRRGAFVAPLTREDILDHFAIYGSIAGLAARRAAEVISEAQLAELAELAARPLPLGADGKDSSCFQFHRYINRIGASRRLRSALKLLGPGIPGKMPLFEHDWMEQAGPDHVKILRALQDHDPGAAYQGTVGHVRHLGRYWISKMEASGFWASPRETGLAANAMPPQVQRLATELGNAAVPA